MASRKVPPLNRPTRPSTLRVPSGKMMSERAPPTSRVIFLRMPAPGFFLINQQVPGPLQVPAQERKRAERRLRDDP